MSTVSPSKDRSGIAAEIREPASWKFDGDLTKRVAVIDPMDGRVVRKVGYLRCLPCGKVMFSRCTRGHRIFDACRLHPD